MSRSVLALLVLALLLPAAADASPTSVGIGAYSFQPGGGGSGIQTQTTLRLRGSADPEALGVRRQRDRIVVRAVRGTLAAGRSCRQLSARAVRCPLADRVDARMLGGDDTLVLHTRFGGREIDGGSGDDVLEDRFTRCLNGCSPVPGVGRLGGGPGDDRLKGQELVGGTGNDLLAGTAADDRLSPGEGRDRVLGGDGADVIQLADDVPDLVDGGSGLDRADHTGSPDPVDVDLAEDRGDDGDVLALVEDAVGGSAADVLRGDAGPNQLDDGDRLPVNGGSAQDDLLDGREGDDVLVVGPGNDRALGGPGDDRVQGYDARATIDTGPGDDIVRVATLGRRGPVRTTCGVGADRVEDPGPGDDVAADCERVQAGLVTVVARRLSPGGERLELTLERTPGIPVPDPARFCGVRVTVLDTAGPDPAGRADASLSAGTVAVDLSPTQSPGRVRVALRFLLCTPTSADDRTPFVLGPFLMGI